MTCYLYTVDTLTIPGTSLAGDRVLESFKHVPELVINDYPGQLRTTNEGFVYTFYALDEDTDLSYILKKGIRYFLLDCLTEEDVIVLKLLDVPWYKLPDNFSVLLESRKKYIISHDTIATMAKAI